MSSLQRRSFILLYTANGISGIAQGISMIAIPWYFLTIINRPQLLGLVYFIATFIQIFWGLYSGSLIDRYSRKKIFLFINASAGTLLLTVAGIGYWLGGVPVFLVAVVFASTFFVYNIHYPNLYAFAQEIIKKEDYSRINSQIEIVGQVTNALAGGLASVLLSGSDTGVVRILALEFNTGIQFSAWQLHQIFLMDGVTYVLSLLIISAIRYQFTLTIKDTDSNIYERLREGFRFLAGHKPLFLFGTASLTVFLTVIVSNYMMAPTYIFHYLKADATVFGGMEIAFASGAILSGLFIRHIAVYTNEVNAVIGLMFLSAAVYAAMLWNQSINIFYMLILLYGMSNAGVRILRVTYIFHHVPNHIFGRTGGVFLMIHILLRLSFIALISMPFFSEGIHILRAYLVFALFLLLSSLLILYYRKSL